MDLLDRQLPYQIYVQGMRYEEYIKDMGFNGQNELNLMQCYWKNFKLTNLMFFNLETTESNSQKVRNV